MKKYNKLVRDKILEIIIKKGGKPKFHIANREEYWKKLQEKLGEEFLEFSKAKNEADKDEELADLCEVLDAIRKFKGKKLREIQAKKSKERGKFNKKIILEES